jgi:sterol desaturase/sphingolipid hydroxylase (fatty acid hydroxylase superfamily)
MQVFGSWSEPVVRFTVFAVVLLTMAALELLLPKRLLTASKARRWVTNFTIVGLATLLVRAIAVLPRLILPTLLPTLLPLTAVAAALWAEAAGVGLLPWLARVVALPSSLASWLPVAIAIVVLDFAIWLQHVLSHKWAPLWALHQVHHADRDIDVTTAIRFHPVEIALSMLYKMAWVVVFGVSPLAVVLFEIILNAGAMFNHANVALPGRLDQLLRLLIVTPDMHRVHHSTRRHEHDSNYGFSLSVWDRLAGTYTAQPEGGHQGMTIGLAHLQTAAPTRLGWSLLVPFGRVWPQRAQKTHH